jgi:hypothetical protein
MSEHLAIAAKRFLEYRRALGRKYISEEHELRLLVRFAEAHGICDLDQLTAVGLEMFLASRPRCRLRSLLWARSARRRGLRPPPGRC